MKTNYAEIYKAMRSDYSPNLYSDEDLVIVFGETMEFYLPTEEVEEHFEEYYFGFTNYVDNLKVN